MSIEFPKDSGVMISGNLPTLHRDSWFEPPIVVQATLAPMNLIQIGAFTGIYGGRLGHCKIGRYCSIAYGVDIASDQHPTDWLSSSMAQYVPNLHGWGDWLKRHHQDYISPQNYFNSGTRVKIGHDVWIGQGVFIKTGVKIGHGAIIAAHSVVINDIPPYSIAAGVPAVVKKQRFNQATIDKLLALNWWDYNVMSIESLNFKEIDSTIALLTRKIDNNELQPYMPPIYKEN